MTKRRPLRAIPTLAPLVSAALASLPCSYGCRTPAQIERDYAKQLAPAALQTEPSENAA
jgi:hypothetical protein